MKSKIYTEEAVENTIRKFGSNKKYFPCTIDGEPALFTENALKVAKATAQANKEDIPGKTFWEALGF